MEREIKRRYNTLQKELGRIPDNSPLGIVFIVWAYISSHKEKYPVREELTLKYWANAFIHSSGRESKLYPLFRELEKEMPQLQNAFTRVVSQSFTESREDLLFHYAHLFRELSYLELDAEEWKILYQLEYEAFLRLNGRRFITDPADLCELMSKVYTALYQHPAQSAVYLPHLRTGDLAVALHQAMNGGVRMIGREENSDLFPFAVMSSIIYGIETIEMKQGSLFEGSKFAYDGLLTILPLGGYREMEVLDFTFSQPLLQSELSVVVVGQGILFNRKYESLRRRMVVDGHLRAVVALPPNALYYTRVRMVMLVFEKNRPDKNILFVNAEALNKATRKAVRLSEEQINELTDMICNNTEREGLSRLVSIDELKAQDFVMNISTLVPDRITETIDPGELWKGIQENQAKIKAFEDEILKSFQKLRTLINQ